MKTLSEELQGRMGRKTQIEFAEELGIAQSTLSEILSGKAVPGLNRTAAAIVRAYPELVSLFLPEDIAVANEHLCGDHAARSSDSEHTGDQEAA